MTLAITLQQVRDLAVDANLVPMTEYFAEWEAFGKWQKEVAERLGGVEGKTVLDIGCGGLRFGAQILGGLGDGHYIGVDPLPEYIELGRRIAAHMGLADKVTLVESGDFEFPDRKADVVMAQSVFTHMDEGRVARCLERVHEAVNPGAVFVFTYIVAGADGPIPNRGALYAQRLPVLLSKLRDETVFTDFARKHGARFERFTDLPHPTGQRVAVLRF